MDLLHNLLGTDIKAGLLVVLNLIVIESLLSVDNAAVLATIVLDLPKEQRKKALRYGIFGAYVLRGACLFVASWLVKIWWLKPVGGIYLIYLTFNYFRKKLKTGNDSDIEAIDKSTKWHYKSTVGILGMFWATVVILELMDLAFSIDNIFAVVAFTNQLSLIYIGVFIGILAMRFVAQTFVNLMEKFTFLEMVAFVIIGVLGIRLTATLYTHFYHGTPMSELLESKITDVFVSVFTISIFLVPVLTSILFNFPKRNIIAEEAEDALDKS